MPLRKGEIIKGYKILEDFVVAGGMSKISFAEKEGKEYFIKEFLSPKYPLPESPGSEKVKAQRRKDITENLTRKLERRFQLAEIWCLLLISFAAAHAITK